MNIRETKSWFELTSTIKVGSSVFDRLFVNRNVGKNISIAINNE